METNKPEMMNPQWILRWFIMGIFAMVGVSCQSVDTRNNVIVSAAEQKMVLMENGKVVKEYPVSTSKYGIGDRKNSYQTPQGRMIIAKKIGCEAPKGAVFKSRQPTGEVLPPDAPGRDPVLTRILWLKGQDYSTRNAFSRHIYIHGTTEERYIGKPVSFGCIRMKSDDVIDLYDRVKEGTLVTVLPGQMPMVVQTAAMKTNMKKAVESMRKLSPEKVDKAVEEDVKSEPERVGPELSRAPNVKDAKEDKETSRSI